MTAENDSVLVTPSILPTIGATDGKFSDLSYELPSIIYIRFGVFFHTGLSDG